MPGSKRQGTDDDTADDAAERKKKKLLKLGVVNFDRAVQVRPGIWVASKPVAPEASAQGSSKSVSADASSQVQKKSKAQAPPAAARQARPKQAEASKPQKGSKVHTSLAPVRKAQPKQSEASRPQKAPDVAAQLAPQAIPKQLAPQATPKQLAPQAMPQQLGAQALGPQAMPQQSAPAAGVLVIGTDAQMFRILLKFGPPDATERHKVQQLLAIPCRLCEPNLLLSAAEKGIESGIHDLARKLRPDISVSVRAVQLKRAIMQMGADFLHLDGYYCLSSVTMPFGLEDIKASVNNRERHVRKEVRNHIDLHVTASAQCLPGDVSPEATAYRALKESCGVRIAPEMWSEEMQMNIRRQLGIDLALKLNSGNGSWVVVLVLPDDAVTSTHDGLLCFDPAASLVHERGLPEEMIVLAGPPELPADWLRVKSRITGQVFFFNMETQEAHLEQTIGTGLPIAPDF